MASPVWPSADDRNLSRRELREKYDSYINADAALVESRRWIEEVTRRNLWSDSFRESLSDGIILCELVEIVGQLSLGRVNRLPTAYAGIDNLNLFFQACERLGLKKLHLFDVTDLQEVSQRGGVSISSKAKESLRRLHNVAITILWLAKAAQNLGYQGPRLDVNCFAHLLPETQFHGKPSKGRGSRKRQSLGEEQLRSRDSENLPPKKRDRVFDKVDIGDRKEKFRSLEQAEKEHSEQIDSHRRKSTGGLLSRDGRYGRFDHKEKLKPSSRMPDPKVHEKQEVHSRGERQDEIQSAAPSDRVRPVSWGPGENRQAVKKKQNPRDVGFKEKQKSFEQIQRQAEMETAILQGKVRPAQLDDKDGRPSKVSLSSKADVKLREKQKDFEKRDYQAQRESAVLQGNLRLSSTDGYENRTQPVMVPKGSQIKLGEKKAAFEQLDKQAEQDISVLRGKRRPPLSGSTEIDERSRRSKVGLPRDANVSLLEKQRTFEEMDSQAKRESEILQRNTRKSFSGVVKESRPLSTSTRPHIGRAQFPSDRQWENGRITRRPHQDLPPRPVSNYYEYKSWNENVSSEERDFEASHEEPVESAPSFEDEGMKQGAYEQRRSVGRNTEPDYIKRRSDISRRRRYSGDEPLELTSVPGNQNLSQIDATSLSYRDLVRAPRKVSRDTFIRERNSAPKAGEMPWRKEIREVKDKRTPLSEERYDRPTSPRSELGKAQYVELAAPPSKKDADSFETELQTAERETDEMPWRKEVREIRKSISLEDSHAFLSSQTAPQEMTRIRPASLKSRDVFITRMDVGNREEMPWRKEVRELKQRRRTEGEDAAESEVPREHVSDSEPSVHNLSYRDFIHQPSKKRRDVFQPRVEAAREEMPWRKEVREIKRTPTEEERVEERMQRSSATNVESSAWEEGRVRLSYHDLSAKPSKTTRIVFVPNETKEKEEMPWRKEVRQLRERPLNEPSEETPTGVSQEDMSSSHKAYMKYNDFVPAPPRRDRDAFVPNSNVEKKEMPWRKEVRKLQEKPDGENEEIYEKAVNHELESTYEESLNRRFARPSKWITDTTHEDINESSKGLRNRSRDQERQGKDPDVRNLSYHDFVCPPSKLNQSQEQVKRKAKVKDLTKKFTNMEAEQNRPRPNGPPSRKSLVDKAELQRIEREMRTRSWHGFPTANDSDDDYDTGVRRRIMSEEEEEEKEQFLRRYQQEKLNDPEESFGQIQGLPPHNKKAEAHWEATAQYEIPSQKESNERRSQFNTEYVPAGYNDFVSDDRDGQFSSHTVTEDLYEREPVRDRPHYIHQSRGDNVVVTQSWIQPKHVEIAESSPYPLEQDVEQWQATRSSEEDQRRGGKTELENEYTNHLDQKMERSHLKDERPYSMDHPQSEISLPPRDERGNEETSFQRITDYNYERKEESKLKEGQMGPDWDRRGGRQPDVRVQSDKPRKVKKDQDRMVFGAPIVVTAKPRVQPQPEKHEPPQRRHGDQISTYTELMPTTEMQTNDRNESQAPQNERDTIEIARSLVLEDIRKVGRNNAPEKHGVEARPQVFAVFGHGGQYHQRSREEHGTPEETMKNVPQMPTNHDPPDRRRGQMHFFDESDQQNTSDWSERNATEESRNRGPGYESLSPDIGQQDVYENHAANHRELYPVVVSTAESQAGQWVDGENDLPSQEEQQKIGRIRVMNFTSDNDDEGPIQRDVEIENESVLPVKRQPGQSDDEDRKKEQKEKEEILKMQLRDAEYRAKYRKEFEEKNRKQRENSKYLMSLQMRASFDSEEEDVVIDGEREKLPHDETGLHEMTRQEPHELTGRSGRDDNFGEGDSVTDEHLPTMVAAQETYWNEEQEQVEARRHGRARRTGNDDSFPPINGMDFVGEENQIRFDGREEFDQTEHAREEKEFTAQEAETIDRERYVVEPIISPSEKPPAEFAFDETLFDDFPPDDSVERHAFDENSNRYMPPSNVSGLKSSHYFDEEYTWPESIELNRGKTSDNISKPREELHPVNGHHYDYMDYRKAPSIENERRLYQDDFLTQPDDHSQMNGFARYNIYETFIHGESNHVVCSACGTSIEKSPSIYVAELDHYWHQDCFCCVVCGAWFGDEDSPALHITGSMLHCERCFITDDGERCTEV